MDCAVLVWSLIELTFTSSSVVATFHKSDINMSYLELWLKDYLSPGGTGTTTED